MLNIPGHWCRLERGYRRQLRRQIELPTDRHFLGLSETCLYTVHFGLGHFFRKSQHRFTIKVNRALMHSLIQMLIPNLYQSIYFDWLQKNHNLFDIISIENLYKYLQKPIICQEFNLALVKMRYILVITVLVATLAFVSTSPTLRHTCHRDCLILCLFGHYTDGAWNEAESTCSCTGGNGEIGRAYCGVTCFSCNNEFTTGHVVGDSCRCRK